MKDQVLLVLIGAAIGFCSSAGIILLERAINRAGKLNIYYKFIHAKADGHPWGVRDNGSSFSLIIPAVFELQNISNSTRIIRNLDVELFCEGKFVARMVQIEYDECSETKGNGVVKVVNRFGGDNGTYSFVLPPRSIQKQKCEFVFSMPKEYADTYNFDSLMITYYNERDKKKQFTAKKELNGWQTGFHKADSDWVKLK